MQTTLLALLLLAAQPDMPESAAKASATSDPAAATADVNSDEADLPPGGGRDWPLIIHKPNPNRTLGMVRYIERGGYLYARPYDYRTLLDYPWHHRKPLHPPCPVAVSTPYELIPAPLPQTTEEVPAPNSAARRYPDVEVAPLESTRGSRSDITSEARLRRLIAPLGRPGDHLVR